MDFKNQVEQILQNRNSNLAKIEADENKISELQEKVRAINALVESNDDKEIKNSLKSIKSALEKLQKAAEKIRNVRERFSRKTINIGVSGIARVGKSTVLQNLTGLKDEQIPTGSGQPVTACRSRIFNQSQDEKEYAVVSFFTEAEFLQNRIMTFCENLPYQFSSIKDFLSADFSKKTEAYDELQVEKNKKLEKLLSIQKAYQYYENLLGSSDKTIHNLDELKKYVAYSDDSDENRLYPAVKNVDIHCHFPSLDGVKVQLIDLPGFGEIGKVDKIQLDGLETEVDHALVVLKPAEGTFVNQQYSNMAQTLSSVQKDVKDRKNLMSYALNKDVRMANVDLLTDKLKEDLIQNDKTVDADCNLYEIEAVNADSVQEMFSKILARMITALPEMDRDFLNAYKAELDFEDIKENLKHILEIVEKSVKSTPSEQTKITNKANDIRFRIGNELDKIWKKTDDELKDRFGKVSDNIKKNLSKEIKENLLFKPTDDYSSWKEYINLRSVKHKEFASVYYEERDRLRIRILDEYESLNKFYKEEIENLREEVVRVFRSHTGNFVPSEQNARTAIDKIIGKLESVRPETEPLIAAFDWINRIELDFRQCTYPMIFDSEEFKDFRKDAPVEELKTAEDLEAQLQTLALCLVDNIRSKLLDADITAQFIKCTLEHFIDLIIRKDESVTENAFRAFVDAYKEELMPKDYGKISDKETLLKLQKNINAVLSDMDKLQNS